MRNQNQNNQKGFTVVELLVVFVIMVVLSSVGVVTWNKQKPRRSLVLAQNETTTNLRKVQSYAVSSRNLPSGEAPKYYLVRLEEGASSYTVHAVYGTDYTYTSTPIETINLPLGVSFTNIVLTPHSGTPASAKCMFAIFSVVYGKTYLYGSSTCDSSITTVIQNFPDLAPYANNNLSLSFAYSGSDETKGLKVYGLSGKVEAVNSTSSNSDPAPQGDPGGTKDGTGGTKDGGGVYGGGGLLGGPEVPVDGGEETKK